jgi:hypothetical protein
VLTLKRQEDGNFRGTIEVEYHQLVQPGKPHSWGHVTPEFLLPKGAVFPQSGPKPDPSIDPTIQ